MGRNSLSAQVIGCLMIGLFLALVPRQASAAQDTPLDIVIVIDQSGSMGVPEYGESDPNGLRWDAAAMLIDLLSTQDRVGVVPFSTNANPLFPELTPLNSQQRLEQLRDKMDEAKRSTLGDRTAYLKALSATRQLLIEDSNQRAVIFLTDGLPTDASLEDIDKNQDLRWFREQNIRVYFLWLKNNSQTSDLARVEAVRTSFEETGPPSVQIEKSTDIVYAFARVLTDLQPGTYLDRFDDPVPDQPGKWRFEARASTDQLLSEATFIFVPSEAPGNFIATVTNQPQNAKVDNTPGRTHAVIKTVSTDATPINGGWSITTNARDTVAFAFLRSDLQQELVYPRASRGALWNNESTLIGVRLSGVPVGQASSSLQASLIPGGCAERSRSQNANQVYPLQPIGLSVDNGIYWYLVPAPDTPMAEGRIGIYVQLGQLNQPVRLSQCHDATVQTGVANALTVVKPTDSDPLTNGAIPIEVNLSSQVDWESVTAYVRAPDGKVHPVSLPPGAPAGAMQDVSQSGLHEVRVVAVGRVNGLTIALLRETTYPVPATLVADTTRFDLGEIKELGQNFNEVLTMSGAFISQANLPTFGPAEVLDDTDQVVGTSLVQVKLCDLPEIVDKKIRCAVTVEPSNNLPPGSYAVRVPMQQSDPPKDLGLATLAFTRPASRLLLSTAMTDLGMVEVTNRILTSTLQFQGSLWEGDPQLPTHPELLKLRRTTDQLDVDKSLIETEMTPQIGGAKLAYELTLRPDNSLPPGKYRAEYALAPAATNLVAEPHAFVVQFEMPAPGVYLQFQQPSSVPNVWGLPMWLPLRREFLLPVIATTVHMTGAPALELPEVARVTSPDEKTLFPSTVEPVEWRDLGPVEGIPNQYRYLLVLRIANSLNQGKKLVTLRMPKDVQSQQEYTAPVAVLGWGRAWWMAGCPFTTLLLTGLLAFSVRRARRNEFTGTFICHRTVPGMPKLELNLSEYKKYRSIEPIFVRKEGKWKAVKSENRRAVRIDLRDRDTIAVFDQGKTSILKKGHSDKRYTYR